jgi:hypothetical protein
MAPLLVGTGVRSGDDPRWFRVDRRAARHHDAEMRTGSEIQRTFDVRSTVGSAHDPSRTGAVPGAASPTLG